MISSILMLRLRSQGYRRESGMSSLNMGSLKFTTKALDTSGYNQERFLRVETKILFKRERFLFV